MTEKELAIINERFDGLEDRFLDRVEKLERSVNGNGQPGLLQRVAKVEAGYGLAKFVAAASAGSLITVIVKLLGA